MVVEGWRKTQVLICGGRVLKEPAGRFLRTDVFAKVGWPVACKTDRGTTRDGPPFVDMMEISSRSAGQCGEDRSLEACKS